MVHFKVLQQNCLGKEEPVTVSNMLAENPSNTN